MQISEHFSRREAEKSQTALRHKIDNTIPDMHLRSVIAVAENILEPVRRHYGMPFSPSSWYRSEDLCIALGSNKGSQHARGEAVDFEVPGISNYDLAKFISETLDFDQLILEYYNDNEPHSGWVHVSYCLYGKNRKQVLRYNGHRFKQGLK